MLTYLSGIVLLMAAGVYGYKVIKEKMPSVEYDKVDAIRDLIIMVILFGVGVSATLGGMA